MKKILLINLLSILSFSPILSQINKCSADEIHNRMMATDADYARKMLDYEAYIVSLNNSVRRTAAVVYRIPVVIHVMHKGEAVGVGTNVSDAAIQKAIKDLNEMYRKIPGSVGDGNGVDVEIEYALAVRNPSGNCTNGINRVNMSGNAAYMSNGVNANASGGISDATLKGIAGWTRTAYYNIWLISEIDNNNGGSGIQGYAYFASSHGTALDGSVILSSNFTSGTSTTAAHEIGHSLNLFHTFEGDGSGANCPSAANGCGNGAGDCCGDIPAHRRSSSDCATGNNVCTNTPRDLFIRNYLDYSSDVCQNMLTANQKTRMQGALTTTRASYLASNGNLSLVPVSTAGVDFTASASVLCGTGQSISFIDKSTCVPNTYNSLSSFSGISHLWTITNGINTYTSSAQNPTITFTNTGSFNVTLAVTTGTLGTVTVTKTGMVVVSAGAPIAGCIPSSSNVGNFGQTISNVRFNTINSPTSTFANTAYSNLSCTYNTVVTEGSMYNMRISANASGNGAEIFEVYIDYNNNGVFTNPAELVFSGSTPINTSATFTSNITIPTTAVKNTLLRMRVIGELNSISPAKRTCGVVFSVGDVEDYGVYILSNSGCTTPTITSITSSSLCGTGSLTLSATTTTGTINWYTAATGGTAIASGTTFITPSLTTSTTYFVDANVSTCTSVARTSVIASLISIPIVTLAVSSSSLCSGNSATLTASGALSYSWAPSITGATRIVSPSLTKTFTVIGTSNGCSSLPRTTTVTVITTPTVNIINSNPVVCTAQSSTLTASGAVSFSWTPSFSGPVNTVTPPSTTNYTVIGRSGFCASLPVTTTVAVVASLVVTITPSSSSICAGQTTTLTASGASSYTWTPFNTGSTNAVTPGSTTSYTLVGGSGSCFSSPVTVTITVGAAIPDVTVSVSSSTICSGQPTTLSAVGATNYTWSPSNSGSSIVQFPTSTTTYTVVGFTGICSSLPKTIIVNVIAAPIITLTALSATICVGQSSTLTANGASSYTWTPLITGATNVVSPTVTSNYSVIGTLGTCNSLSYSTTINVNAIPNVTLTTSNATICPTQSAILTAIGASSYTWFPSGSGNSITVSPIVSTIYSVTGSNGNCIAITKTISVGVSAGSLPIISAVPGSTSICRGSSINQILSGATTYTWLPSGSGSNSVLSPSVNTTYTIIGTAGGCKSSPINFALTIATNPTVNVSSSSSLICANETSTLTASLGSSSYSWSPGSSLNVTTSNVVIANPTITTTYTVVAKIGNCASTKTITLSVNLCTGLEDLNASNLLLLYPNPTKDLITIKLNSNNFITNVSVTNTLGQVVLNQSDLKTGELQIDLSALSNGVYYLKTSLSNGVILNKIIKQ